MTGVVTSAPIVVQLDGAIPVPYSSWKFLKVRASLAEPVIVTAPASGRYSSGAVIEPAGMAVSTRTQPDVVGPVLPAEFVRVWTQRYQDPLAMAGSGETGSPRVSVGVDRREGDGAHRLTDVGDQLFVGVEIRCPRRWRSAVRPGGSPAVP